MSIHPTAIIEKNVDLSENVSVGPFSILRDKIKISSGVKIDAHCVLEGNTVIGKNTKIGIGTIIGSPPQDLKYKNEDTKVIIGNNCVIREYVTINRGTAATFKTEIGNNCFIMSYVHIAHDCKIGDEVILANCATLGGHITIENQAIIGGMTPIHQFVRIGKLSMVGGSIRLTKDAPPFSMISGEPAQVYGLNNIGLKRQNYSIEDRKNLKATYKILFHSGLNTSQALKKIETESFYNSPSIQYLVEFIINSKRGICKTK